MNFLQEYFGNITLRSCDASTASDLRDLVEKTNQINSEIFHCSGSLSDKVITSQNPESVRCCYGPKVSTCTPLEAMVKLSPFKAFLLCSSISGFIGSHGQSNYASSNKFLDGWSTILRSMGVPKVVSIAWGAWQGLGMAAKNPLVLNRVKKSGLGAIKPQVGLKIIFDIITGDPTLSDMIASPLDISTLSSLRQTSTVLQALVDSMHRTNEIINSRKVNDIAKITDDLRNPWNKEDVEQRLIKLIHNITGITILRKQPLMQYGVDSLSSQQIKDSIAEEFAVAVPATLVFDYPTIDEIADYICQYSPMHAESIPNYRQSPAHDQHRVLSITNASYIYPKSNHIQFRNICQYDEDLQTTIPRDRWDIDQVYTCAEFIGPKDIDVRFGCFLSSVESFDSFLFGISPPQGQNMDPQQRLLLEESYQVLQQSDKTHNSTGMMFD